LCRYQIKTAGSQTLASGVLPFTLSAPLAVTVRPFFLSPKVLYVEADLRRVSEWQASAKLTFSIRSKSSATPLASVERTFDGAQQLAAEVPTAELAPGGYELVTELTGADGKRKAMLADGFTKPADPK